MATGPRSIESARLDLARVIASSRAIRSVRACLLTTRDRDHALSLLKRTAVESHSDLLHFTVASRRRYNPKTLAWETIGGESDVVGLLRAADEIRGEGVVILEDCTAFLRDEGGDPRLRMLLARMLSSEQARQGLVLIFLEPPESEGRLPSMLADRFVRLEVRYPRAEELESIAREEVARMAHGRPVQLDVESIQSGAARLAPGVVGLTRSAARDALRDALAADPSDFAASCAQLETRKADQLRRELAMNVLSTDDVEEPIGLDYLVEHLTIARDKMATYGAQRARGVILIGPPGTGKTMIARAIGSLVGLPVVQFLISALMNSLLGATEGLFARAFQTLEAMAPNVVFIDEIEKAFGDSTDRDGGTMMRCTGALLSWLSDNPYPNFIVATSNSLRRMGEIGLTMTRSERFDAAFFVDVPSLESRRRMLLRWLQPAMTESEDVALQLAQITEKFSGADLRSAVKQAMTTAEYGARPLTLEGLKAQVERKRFRAIALYDEFQELRRWGRVFCDPAGPTDN